MAIKNTLEGKMTYRIKRSAEAVFMRRDFKDLGGYDQVGRVTQYKPQAQALFLMHNAYFPNRLNPFLH